MVTPTGPSTSSAESASSKTNVTLPPLCSCRLATCSCIQCHCSSRRTGSACLRNGLLNPSRALLWMPDPVRSSYAAVPRLTASAACMVGTNFAHGSELPLLDSITVAVPSRGPATEETEASWHAGHLPSSARGGWIGLPPPPLRCPAFTAELSLC